MCSGKPAPNDGRPRTEMSNPVSYLTQLSIVDNDLDFLSFTLTPDSSASFCASCAETISALLTDPTGDTISYRHVPGCAAVTFETAPESPTTQ